jgi:hypothetical protein
MWFAFLTTRRRSSAPSWMSQEFRHALQEGWTDPDVAAFRGGLDARIARLEMILDTGAPPDSANYWLSRFLDTLYEERARRKANRT